jgi:hypothetical protein
MKKSIVCFGLFQLVAGFAGAQTLPAPSRTVYKCQDQDKTFYSDSPCLGAQKITIEPTRGISRSTGRDQVSQDVERERRRELLAEAVRPISGLNARQFDQAGRRQKLSIPQQRECKQLDVLLPTVEHAERNANGTTELKSVQRELFELRKRYREYGCE